MQTYLGRASPHAVRHQVGLLNHRVNAVTERIVQNSGASVADEREVIGLEQLGRCVAGRCDGRLSVKVLVSIGHAVSSGKTAQSVDNLRVEAGRGGNRLETMGRDLLRAGLDAERLSERENPLGTVGSLVHTQRTFLQHGQHDSNATQTPYLDNTRVLLVKNIYQLLLAVQFHSSVLEESD